MQYGAMNFPIKPVGKELEDIAALGFDYFEVGYTAGLKAVEILKGGKSPGDVPSSLTKKLRLVVNPKAAQEQGITLDEKYIEMAKEVVK